MAQTVDWVPKTYEFFLPFALNMKKMASANQLVWKLVPTSVTDMGKQVDDFVKDYSVSSVIKSRSSNDVDNTKRSFKKARASVRSMGIIQMKYNLNMTDEDRTSCGVVNNSGNHTLSPVAGVAPEAIFARTGNFGGKLRFIDPATEVGGRPLGQDAISISFGFYAPDTTPPLEVDCTQTVLFSKQIGRVVFAPANINKLFIGYVRYVNTRKILGTIASVVMGAVY